MTNRQRGWLAMMLIGALAACHNATPAADDGPCSCTPGNRSLTRAADGAPIDGATLLNRLRLHKREVDEHRTPRDIKVLDDQLRFEISNFCQPCGDWVQDRMTIEDLYPLGRLDDATGAVCMGLVLRDGTTAWGDARPHACR
ncbi:MAG TPA: hypothetical protein VH165_35115 [Kofleriaceae bacterium]|jgi:hypothetical protein|nr:hypothetical protein [Kofleriaceae bacterium]